MNADTTGDWTTQSSDPVQLYRAMMGAYGMEGAERVKQKADEGHRAAQYTEGCRLLSEAKEGRREKMGAGGRSPKADVGLAASHFAPKTFRPLTKQN
jgi:hypothetical protein